MPEPNLSRPSVRLSIASTASLALLASCASIGGSIESSSDSAAGAFEVLASPFEASSRSSGGDGTADVKAVYLRDVTAFTVVHLRTPAAEGEFARGLSQVATAHGINDWERDPETFEAVAAAAEVEELDDAARARLQHELRTLAPAN